MLTVFSKHTDMNIKRYIVLKTKAWKLNVKNIMDAGKFNTIFNEIHQL